MIERIDKGKVENKKEPKKKKDSMAFLVKEVLVLRIPRLATSPTAVE